jgi:hypothetical protein
MTTKKNMNDSDKRQSRKRQLANSTDNPPLMEDRQRTLLINSQNTTIGTRHKTSTTKMDCMLTSNPEQPTTNF